MNIFKSLCKMSTFGLVLITLVSVVGCASINTAKPVKLLMSTTLGDVEMTLYPDKAPVTVANFLRYVDAGAYRDGSFYRVVRHDNDNGSPKITVIQGGARKGVVEWQPIPLETTEVSGINHLDGTLSMARAEPQTATTAFFICIGAQPGLDFGGKRAKDGLGFAAFGKVTRGMDVVKAINQIRNSKSSENPYMQGQMLSQPVLITDIKRL